MPITEGGKFSPVDRIVSPGVFTRENDLSGVAQGVAEIGAVVLAPFAKGPGFAPTLITNTADLEEKFGVADGVYYGTGGAFTAVSVNGGVETLLNVFYTGSNFLVYGANGGLYISSNNTPVTWSVYNGIPSGGTRTILANSFAIGQRMTAS